MKEIRFDNIAELKAQVSEAFGEFGKSVEVTQPMIQAFADLTGDQQWIHTDVERCKKESPFGGPIAHGYLTLSLTPQLRPTSAFSVVGYKNAINYGLENLRFLAPVPSGAKIHSHMRLATVEEKPKGTLVGYEIAVHALGSDKPALLFRALVLYQGKRAQGEKVQGEKA
jgi:acyl dehydratase